MPHTTAQLSERMLRHIALALLCSLNLLTPHAALATDAKASKYYEDALVRYEKKDLEGAIIQLKNALQIDKNMLPVQMLLGKALLQSGDVVAAEVAFNEALRLGVNRAEVVIPLGQAYMAQGKLVPLLQQQQFNPAGLPPAVQIQVLLLRAAANSDLGDTRNALKNIEEARAIDPKSASSWLAEVPIRIRALQFKEAAAAADRGMALAPDSAEAWYQKGSVQHSTGDLTGAVASYSKALSIDADRVDVRVARVGIYVDLGQKKEATSEVTQLVGLLPGEPRVAYLQALLAEQDNRPVDARTALKEVVNLIDPVPPDYLRYRPQLLMLNGLAHYGLNEREKAKQYLEAFQKVQGNSAATKILAQIYLSEPNIDRAIEVLETYLKAQPTDSQAMTMLGSALMVKGQNARATTLMKKALQTQDAPGLRTVLGMSLIRSGQSGSGISELESAYKKNPKQTGAATALLNMYLKAGQTAKAIAVAEDLVKQQPTNAEFFNLLGMARGQSRNYPAARTAFEQSLKLVSTYIPPSLNLARLDIATKAYDAATKRLNDVLKVDPRNAEAMAEMAIISERTGKLPEAQRWLEKAVDVSGPKEQRWNLALSDFHLRNANASAALDAAKSASAKGPEELSVLMAYAKAQLAVGDIAAAKNLLMTATKLADYDPAKQVQIAMLQLAANNLPGASYSLDKALSGQADFLPAQALMAEVDLRQGDQAKAEKRAREIIASQPKRAVGYSLLGDISMARGQKAAALDNYRKAHQLEPSTETLLRLSRAMGDQDGGKAAAQLAEQWTKTHPKDIISQKALADGYARSGNLPQARLAYERVLKLDPDDAEALNNLANILLLLNDSGAIKIAEQAVAKNPGNAGTIDTLGWILFKNGQPDRALQLLRDARLRQPGNPEIAYHLAAALAQAGRKAEAKAELESALRSGSSFDGADQAKTLLKSLN
ncbi:XrtA/PEP-CTERM system TPR-repeat protein PrsT [Rhodoferax sp. GW822-FHT02A01]|uniref:XrtA/PEP-CTERM system TPR-repeat protein PrsT n=1 Tax=Rhodoferax sp. GW822-FHT02A01 TaxID=3141537 RepID=UPI00315C54EF